LPAASNRMVRQLPRHLATSKCCRRAVRARRCRAPRLHRAHRPVVASRSHPSQAAPAKRTHSSVLDIEKHVNKRIRVKFQGGREGASSRARIVVTRARVSYHSSVCARTGHLTSRTPSASQLPAVVGVLKGFDQLVNLVLDEAVEYLRGACRPCARAAKAPRCSDDTHAHSSPSILAVLSHRPPPPAPADPADPLRITDETRGLGLVVCRGPQVSVVCPEDELREIPNPFVAPEEE